MRSVCPCTLLLPEHQTLPGNCAQAQPIHPPGRDAGACTPPAPTPDCSLWLILCAPAPGGPPRTGKLKHLLDVGQGGLRSWGGPCCLCPRTALPAQGISFLPQSPRGQICHPGGGTGPEPHPASPSSQPGEFQGVGSQREQQIPLPALPSVPTHPAEGSSSSRGWGGDGNLPPPGSCFQISAPKQFSPFLLSFLLPVMSSDPGHSPAGTAQADAKLI